MFVLLRKTGSSIDVQAIDNHQVTDIHIVTTGALFIPNVDLSSLFCVNMRILVMDKLSIPLNNLKVPIVMSMISLRK